MGYSVSNNWGVLRLYLLLPYRCPNQTGDNGKTQCSSSQLPEANVS